MSMAAPVALTIDLSAARSELPSDLQTRLAGSPTKSPEDLASALQAHALRTAALREAHLEAIKDRARRESQRQSDAAARKLRIAASKASKIQAKIDSSTSKLEAKTEANESEREARKARRMALATAVAEARVAADEAKTQRAKALLGLELHASAKHAKQVEAIKQRASSQVRHALAVASAHAEATALARSTLADKITDKLEAAESRRELFSSPTKGTIATAGLGPVGMMMATSTLTVPSTTTSTTSPRRRHHSVLNDSKVESEMRRLVHEASMAKAAEKRDAHIEGIKVKAATVASKAATVVAQQKTKAAGTDEATAEAKHLMYDRMVRAETDRLFALKARYGAHSKGDSVSAIVVRMDDVLTPKPPPAALALRLSTVSSSLVETAAARQRGAAARRLMQASETLQKAAKAAAKQAAVRKQIAKGAAAKAAKALAKARLSQNVHAMVIGQRAHVISLEHKRINSAEHMRQTLAAARKTRGESQQAKCNDAAERHAAKLRAVAKVGVTAVKLARNKTRREAATAAVKTRGAALAARCAAAAAKKAELIAQRIEMARKRQKAVHPRREMPDEEIKTN